MLCDWTFSCPGQWLSGPSLPRWACQTDQVRLLEVTAPAKKQFQHVIFLFYLWEKQTCWSRKDLVCFGIEMCGLSGADRTSTTLLSNPCYAQSFPLWRCCSEGSRGRGAVHLLLEGTPSPPFLLVSHSTCSLLQQPLLHSFICNTSIIFFLYNIWSSFPLPLPFSVCIAEWRASQQLVWPAIRIEGRQILLLAGARHTLFCSEHAESKTHTCQRHTWMNRRKVRERECESERCREREGCDI